MQSGLLYSAHFESFELFGQAPASKTPNSQPWNAVLQLLPAWFHWVRVINSSRRKGTAGIGFGLMQVKNQQPRSSKKKKNAVDMYNLVVLSCIDLQRSLGVQEEAACIL